MLQKSRHQRGHQHPAIARVHQHAQSLLARVVVAKRARAVSTSASRRWQWGRSKAPAGVSADVPRRTGQQASAEPSLEAYDGTADCDLGDAEGAGGGGEGLELQT